MLIRKGQCNRCGQCCKFTGKKGCSYLEFKNGIAFCKIYKNRPSLCRSHPANKKQFIVNGIEIKNCGFYFVEENDK